MLLSVGGGVPGDSHVIGTGADEAVQWILEHQGDPGIDDPLPHVQPAPQRPVKSFSTASAGIAGILRREELLAAATDQ